MVKRVGDYFTADCHIAVIEKRKWLYIDRKIGGTSNWLGVGEEDILAILRIAEVFPDILVEAKEE